MVTFSVTNHLFPLLTALFPYICFSFLFISVCYWVMDAKPFCFKSNGTDESCEVMQRSFPVRSVDFNYLWPIT